jgi:hypothetical protein
MPLGFCRLGWPHQSSAAVCPLFLSVRDKSDCILAIRRGPYAFTNVLMWEFCVLITVGFVDVAQFTALTTLSIVFSCKSWTLHTVWKCLPFLGFASDYPVIWFSGTLQNTCSFLTETVPCVITFILSVVVHTQNSNVTSSTPNSSPTTPGIIALCTEILFLFDFSHFVFHRKISNLLV